MYEPFSPAGATVTISATTTTARADLVVRGGGRTSVMVSVDPGGAICFCRLTDSAGNALTTDMPVYPGDTKFIRWSRAADTHVAVITGTGTATFRATPGQGA